MEIVISTKVLKKSLAVTLAFLIALGSMWTGLGAVGFAVGENFENENGIEFMEADGNVTDGNVQKVLTTGSCGDNITYTLYSDGRLVLEGTGEIWDCSYNIFEKNDDYDNADSVKVIEIGEGITSIGDNAFYSCNSLTSVTIPDSVTSIGEGAFEYCTELTNITIGKGTTSISSTAFLGSGLIEINVVSDNESYSSIDGILFNKDKTEIIRYPERKTETSYSIPDTVKSIGSYAFYSCKSLTNIIIPDSVTSIGERAFRNCSSLTSIIIPDNVTSIGESVFYSCHNLTSVTIPDSVTSIGERAFEFCHNLTSVTIPDSVTSIGERAFKHCSSLTSIIIPDSVTSIGESVFFSCDSLTSIIIPDSVTSIGDSAFVNCDSLTNIIIPDSVTSIGDSAFGNCDSLTSIIIPDSVTSIGDSAFSSCDSLTSITIGKGTTSISSTAFLGSGLIEINVVSDNESYSSIDGILFNKDKTEIIRYPEGKTETSYSIPDTVKSIGSYAFYSCKSLTNIIIPDSVTSIGESVFYSCHNLTSIIIPDSVTSIGYFAFCGCESLTSIIIPDSVTSIGDFVFKDCSDLTNITIGNGVTSISKYAFYSCDSLISITIPDSVTVIGDYAFGDCDSLTSITIGKGVTSISNEAFCDEFFNESANVSVMEINVVSDNESYSSIDGVLFNKDKTEIIKYPGKKTEISYSIPNTVTSIGDYAFEFCHNLTSVTIPNSVTSIGKDAFEFCDSLTNIIIPDSVTSIGAWAFGYCTSLTSIIIPGSVKRIEECTFDSCYSLTSVTIGNGIARIDEYVFMWCKSLKNVTIPNSVTSIGNGAFFGCNDDLVIHGYKGSSAETYANENWIEFKAIGEKVTDGNVTDGNVTDGNINECRHTNKQTVSQQNATCTTDGYTAGTYCPDCKAWLDGHEVIEAKHSYNSVVTNPTCTEKGYTTHTCTACGNGYTDSVVDALGHDWNTEWTVDKKATCSVEGSKSYHCKRCDEKKDVTAIEKEPHTPTTYTQKASCTVNGYTLTSCSVCGDELSFEVLNATNHENKYTVAQQNATCTTDGYTAGTYCPDCKAWLDGHEVIKAKHSYNSVVTNPTCTENGYTTHTCTACGNGYTDSVVDALGHDWNTEWTVDKKATCSVEGSKSYHCKRCDEKKDVTAIEKEPHTPTTYTQKASCTVNGYTLTSCSVCGDELSFEVLNATNHENKYTVAQQNATCTTDGYTAGTYCPDCKAWLDGHEVIKAKHSYNSVVTNPTCTENGYTTHTCTACGNGYTDSVVDALGHDYGKWTVEVEATLLNEGKEVRSCSRCPSQESKTVAKLKGEVTKDENSGVKIEYTDESYDGENMEVVVEEDFNGSQYLGQSYGNFVSWDIKTYVNGIEAQPDAPVLVTIPIPAGFDKNMIVVYHVNSITGKLEKIEPVVIEGDSIKFLANSFSTYIVVDEGSFDEGNPSENCSCNCHKKGIMAFLWKIICFFCKLFRTNSVCDCGVAHY